MAQVLSFRKVKGQSVGFYFYISLFLSGITSRSKYFQANFDQILKVFQTNIFICLADYITVLPRLMSHQTRVLNYMNLSRI